jgi:hypothetical protein
VTATVKWLPENYRKSIDPFHDTNDDYKYFDIRFDNAQLQPMDKNKIMYLDFDMQKNFGLVIEKDTILPAICQRIESGISNRYEYLVAFEQTKENNDHDFMVVYKDEVFAIGTLAFAYRQADMKKTPTLAVK